MVVFPEASQFYAKWQHSLEARGVRIRLSTEVTRVISRSKRDGVRVAIRSRRAQSEDHHSIDADHDLPEQVEDYDEIVLCILADTAKSLLNDAGWLEKKVLGSAKWSDDVTVTHCVSAESLTRLHHLNADDSSSGRRIHEKVVCNPLRGRTSSVESPRARRNGKGSEGKKDVHAVRLPCLLGGF